MPSSTYRAVRAADGNAGAIVRVTRTAERVGQTLARAARVEDEPLTWEIADGPWFENQVATLDLDGRRCRFRLESAVGAGDEPPKLEQTATRHLA